MTSLPLSIVSFLATPTNEHSNELINISFLNNYAQTGSEYTKKLNQIIKQNRLTDFEPVRLVNSVKKIELSS